MARPTGYVGVATKKKKKKKKKKTGIYSHSSHMYMHMLMIFPQGFYHPGTGAAGAGNDAGNAGVGNPNTGGALTGPAEALRLKQVVWMPMRWLVRVIVWLMTGGGKRGGEPVADAAASGRAEDSGAARRVSALVANPVLAGGGAMGGRASMGGASMDTGGFGTTDAPDGPPKPSPMSEMRAAIIASTGGAHRSVFLFFFFVCLFDGFFFFSLVLVWDFYRCSISQFWLFFFFVFCFPYLYTTDLDARRPGPRRSVLCSRCRPRSVSRRTTRS
jgi:hypothetical protein